MHKEGFWRSKIKWLYPGLGVKRWLSTAFVGALLMGAGLAIADRYQVLGLLEASINDVMQLVTGGPHPIWAGLLVLLLGLLLAGWGLSNMFRSLLLPLFNHESYKIADVVYNKKYLKKGPRIVVIGGGTGLSVLLRGLKQYTSNLTAIVTVADDGGSSGRIRGELGTLPPGDIRNCMVALADTESLMEQLFQHRFDTDCPLGGHSLGNLLLAGMEQITGSMDLAIKEISKVLAMRGQVLPATLSNVKLVAEMESGQIVRGESKIPKARGAIKRVWLEPSGAKALPEAIAAIYNADVVILGPGSLYTSILPNLLIDDIAQALLHSKADKIYVCNVMSQPGETDGYTASKHVQALVDHVGKGVVDCVLVNVERVPTALLTKYALKNQRPVEADFINIKKLGVQPVPEKLLFYSDLVRHDPEKLSQAIMSWLLGLKTGPEKYKISFKE